MNNFNAEPIKVHDIGGALSHSIVLRPDRRSHNKLYMEFGGRFALIDEEAAYSLAVILTDFIEKQRGDS